MRLGKCLLLLSMTFGCSSESQQPTAIYWTELSQFEMYLTSIQSSNLLDRKPSSIKEWQQLGSVATTLGQQAQSLSIPPDSKFDGKKLEDLKAAMDHFHEAIREKDYAETQQAFAKLKESLTELQNNPATDG